MNCPKCNADISDSYEDRSVGSCGGWYCDACEFAIREQEVPSEPMAADAEIISAHESRGDRPLETPLSELSTQEVLMPPDSTSADDAIAEPCRATPPAVTPHRPRLYLAPVLLTTAALALSAVGIAINGWFARSLGSSDLAGWLFLAVGVAADLAALVLAHRSAGNCAGWLGRLVRDVRLRRDGGHWFRFHQHQRRDAGARITRHAGRYERPGDAIGCHGGSGPGMQRRRREVLPRTRSRGGRTASAPRCCDDGRRASGRPPDRRSNQAGRVGLPRHAAARARRLCHAPPPHVGVAATDRWDAAADQAPLRGRRYWMKPRSHREDARPCRCVRLSRSAGAPWRCSQIARDLGWQRPCAVAMLGQAGERP
jgi:hypothetical protein